MLSFAAALVQSALVAPVALALTFDLHKTRKA
jgi:hypothetical protein